MVDECEKRWHSYYKRKNSMGQLRYFQMQYWGTIKKIRYRM